MGLCLVAGAAALLVAGEGFVLGWTHSVERTGWEERWRVEAGGLRLVEARVRGSGAGMDPGEGARLVDGWWVWEPALAPVPELALAASGATGSGWTLCDAVDPGLGCRTLGASEGEAVILRAC